MTVSIIVPTLNEQEMIGPLLQSLEPLRALEIIVADGRSTDATPTLAAPRARVVVSAPSRGIQLNCGAGAAQGDVFLFLHADARLRPGALSHIESALQDPSCPGGNFDLKFAGDHWESALLTRINRARRRFDIFYGDSAIFCRRDCFERLGGFRPWPVLEDYDFVRRLHNAGRLALLDEPVFVSDRRWRKSGLLSTLWSWFWVQALYFAGVSPFRLARLYRHVR
jgi:rSAM/selenodomain-associated transferase 2